MTIGRGAHVGAMLFTLAIAVAALPLAVAVLRSFPGGPVQEGGIELDEPGMPVDVIAPVPESLHSRWYTQTQPPVIAAGASADVTVVFRNVGHAAWIKGTPAEIRLGEVGERPLPPDMRVDWPYPNRPAIQAEDVVHEDQLATFSFKVAGASPGTFRLHLRPVVDGVTWLEDEGVYVDITVTAG